MTDLTKQDQDNLVFHIEKTTQNAYIEIVSAVALSGFELTDNDLRGIGEFTRGNVLAWMESHTGPDWVGILPVEDFHAVCGDIDIPWATKEGGLIFSIRKAGLK